MTFADLYKSLRDQNGEEPDLLGSSSVLISFDPGNTTGYAVFKGLELVETGQLQTETLNAGTDRFQELLTYHKPEQIVFEDYRVYAWKEKQHSWSELHTPKLIGVLESVARIMFIPTHKQPAHVAKRFCADKRLEEWGFYVRGQRHARDAVRHGCYYILFPPKDHKSKSGGQQVG